MQWLGPPRSHFKAAHSAGGPRLARRVDFWSEGPDIGPDIGPEVRSQLCQDWGSGLDCGPGLAQDWPRLCAGSQSLGCSQGLAQDWPRLCAGGTGPLPQAVGRSPSALPWPRSFGSWPQGGWPQGGWPQVRCPRAAGWPQGGWFRAAGPVADPGLWLRSFAQILLYFSGRISGRISGQISGQTRNPTRK